MSKRYKRDKTPDSVNHQSSSCTTYNYRNYHLQPDWSQGCQHCDENINVIRRIHSPDHQAPPTVPLPPPPPPPTCLHLPPSYISSHVKCHSHNNDTNTTNNNNNNSSSIGSTTKHGSQSLVEKAVFRMIKYFDHKSGHKIHESTIIATSEDCLQSDSSCEERPLISNHQYNNNNNNDNNSNNNNNVYPTGASVGGESSTTSTASTCINPTEVENWMRRRLYYHFMTPIGKFQAKRRIPFKLFIQILKVLLVTIQLIQFGFNRAAHVSFGELSHKAFCHLYLHQWDPQYETLDYPPATGVYAVYTIDAFYEHVGYAITQFNKTKELALGGYLFDSTNPTMKLCMKYVSPPMENKSTIFRVALQEVEKCVSIEPQKIDAKQLQDVESIKTFLQIHELIIDFDHLLGFSIHFNLLSPPIYHLDWTQTIECYRFMIKISLENPSQSGQIKILLHAPYASTPCLDLPLTEINDASSSTPQQSLTTSTTTTTVRLTTASSTSPSTSSLNLAEKNKKQDILVKFWNQFNITSSKVSNETNYMIPRGGLVILIDCCTLVLGLISCILCIRSVIQGFRMWLETVRFFKHWFGIQLNGVFWEFVRPWILFIIVNDLIIIITSLYALSTLHRIQMKYEPLTYSMGIGALLVWIGILYYVGFSYDNSLLIRTISRSIPGLLRFCVCALILFFAFSLCGWVVLGPYNLKFRTFMSTVECLYSLINGDDMFVTFTIINENDPIGIYLFSRLFLYLFITLFIYVVLNLFVTIIFEAYEEVKDMQNSRGRPNDSPLWHFVCQHNYDPKSSIFKEDESRPDRHILQEQAQGIFGAGAIGGAGTGSDGGGNSGISGTRHSSTDRLGTGSIISTSVKFKSFLKCQQRQREQHQQKQSQNYQRQQKRRQQIDEYQQEQPRQQQQQQNCRYHHLHPMGNEEIENSMNHRTFNVQQQDKADGTSSISSTIDENDADCRKIIIGHDAADDGDDDGDHDHHGDENEDNYVCNRFSESLNNTTTPTIIPEESITTSQQNSDSLSALKESSLNV